MRSTFRLGVPCLALAVIVALLAPALLRALFGMLSLPLDTRVGNVKPLALGELKQAMHGRRALVVGGTRGIGREIAFALARSGAHVSVVGRSAGEALMRELAHAAGGPNHTAPPVGAYSFDLLSISGCMALIDAMAADGNHVDLLVMTVGMWPDVAEPQTKEGQDKVFALDVVARFALLDGLATNGVLTPDARVLSVLASTQWLPVPQQLETLQAWVRGDDGHRFRGLRDLPSVLSVAGVSHDAMLAAAATHHPSLRLVGTHPGLVPTDVIRPTVPSWSVPFLKAALRLVSSSLSEAECGWVQLQIAASPNVLKRRVSYFNHNMEGRRTLERAYDTQFQTWLWAHLQSVRRGSR